MGHSVPHVEEAGLPDQRIAGSDSSASMFLLGDPGESLGFLIVGQSKPTLLFTLAGFPVLPTFPGGYSTLHAACGSRAEHGPGCS